MKIKRDSWWYKTYMVVDDEEPTSIWNLVQIVGSYITIAFTSSFLLIGILFGLNFGWPWYITFCLSALSTWALPLLISSIDWNEGLEIED